MPKNIGIGGKKKKMGKKIAETARELEFKNEGEEYAQIIRLVGDSRLDVQCADGVKRVAHIRGTMRKKVFMNMGDIVLVAIREFEPEKCDVILKYTEDEVRKLKRSEEIPENFKINETEEKDGGGIGDDEDPVIKFEKKDKKQKKNSDDEEDDDNDIQFTSYGKRKNSEISEDEEDEDDDEDEEEEKKEDEDEDEEEEVEEVKVKYASNKQNKTNKQSGQDKKKIIDDL